jgi:hypothetical protein
MMVSNMLRIYRQISCFSIVGMCRVLAESEISY